MIHHAQYRFFDVISAKVMCLYSTVHRKPVGMYPELGYDFCSPLNYSVLATSARIALSTLVYDSSIDNSVAQQQNNDNDTLNICFVVRYTIARVVYRTIVINIKLP